MITSTLRSAAALLGAIILSVALGGPPAHAQTASCPCLTSEQVDSWFRTTQQTKNQPARKFLCVDDPGFITFDYIERLVPRSLLIDVTYATSRKKARCLVDSSHVVKALTGSRLELTNAQAETCRREILTSRTWSLLGCPNN